MKQTFLPQYPTVSPLNMRCCTGTATAIALPWKKLTVYNMIYLLMLPLPWKINWYIYSSRQRHFHKKIMISSLCPFEHFNSFSLWRKHFARQVRIDWHITDDSSCTWKSWKVLCFWFTCIVSDTQIPTLSSTHYSQEDVHFKPSNGRKQIAWNQTWPCSIFCWRAEDNGRVAVTACIA